MKKMILFSALAATLLSGCVFQQPLPAPEGLEIPSYSENQNILSYQGHTVSYNTSTLIPDWVAYELTDEETHGEATRFDKNFSMDPSFRKKQAMREDYRGSSWTRGHMAPAADFAWDDDAMAETFYFTNICPQREELNNKDWQYLEKQVRYWARDYGKVWVVSGPIVGENRYGRIGDRGVIVPDAFFKALMYEKGGKYHAIAFVMGNDAQRYYLQDCYLTINELENITGIDFFPSLDDAVEEEVEGLARLSDWGLRKR